MNMAGVGKVTAENIRQILKNVSGFEKALGKLKVISAANGNITAELKVEEEHTNSLGTLHGGLSATLVDSISTYGFFTHEKGGYPTVSVDIHMTYLKSASVGEDIVIESKTVKAGKTLAFLEVLIKNKSTGETLVKGSHTKYIMQPR